MSTTLMPRGNPVHGSPRGEPLLPPSRNPVSPSGLTMRGAFASLKNSGFVRFESDLERQVIMLLEFAPGVLQFSHQPPKLTIRVEGRARRYTPDFAAKWSSGSLWLIEVKPSDVAAVPEWQARFDAARVAAHALGYRFVVVTDERTRRPGMADVAFWLERRRRRWTELLGDGARQRDWAAGDVPRPMPSLLDHALASRRQIAVADAVDALGGTDAAVASVAEMLCRRQLVASLDERVSETTLIHAYTEADDESLFL